MFNRVLYGLKLASSLGGRRSLQTIASKGPSSNSKAKYLLGAIAVGGAVGFGLGIDNYAQNATESGTWNAAKESVMTSYERRIRELSSPEKCFNVFASVHKDGKAYMTADDFIRALVPHQFHFNRSKQEKEKALPAAFKIADQNGDGLISLKEYLFFVTLLSIPESSFKVAFHLMDTDMSGTVDQKEFMQVMQLVKRLSPPATQTTVAESPVASGWLAHFFGPRGDKTLTFQQFSGFLKQLNDDVLKMEFDLYDRQNLGYLSQRDFGLLLVSFTNPKEFVHRAEDLDAAPSKQFTVNQFQSFNRLIDNIEDVEMAMQLYDMNRKAFRVEDLSRLSKIVCKTDLNPAVLDTIMRVFDKNKDGSLEVTEFVQVLKKRKSKGLTTPRDTGFVRTFSRIYDCITSGGEKEI